MNDRDSSRSHAAPKLNLFLALELAKKDAYTSFTMDLRIEIAIARMEERLPKTISASERILVNRGSDLVFWLSLLGPERNYREHEDSTTRRNLTNGFSIRDSCRYRS